MNLQCSHWTTQNISCNAGYTLSFFLQVVSWAKITTSQILASTQVMQMQGSPLLCYCILTGGNSTPPPFSQNTLISAGTRSPSAQGKGAKLCAPLSLCASLGGATPAVIRLSKCLVPEWAHWCPHLYSKLLRSGHPPLLPTPCPGLD